MAPLYNGTLALYYYLTICHRFKEDRIRRLILPAHILILLIALGTSITGLSLKLFNNNGNFWCWIAPFPPGCVQSYTGAESTCTRGDNAYLFRWAFWHAPLWLMIFFVTITMTMVFRFVRKQEKAVEQYRYASYRPSSDRFNNESRPTASSIIASSVSRLAGPQTSNTRLVFHQALCYVLVFYIIWVLPAVRTIMAFADHQSHFLVIFFLALLLPAQGFLNFLVYMRPRYIKYKKTHPRADRFTILTRVLGTCCRKCSRNRSAAATCCSDGDTRSGEEKMEEGTASKVNESRSNYEETPSKTSNTKETGNKT